MSSSKKEEIILKATEIISEEGIEKLSLSSLAEGVNIAKATLYNYFTSKDEIIGEIIRTGHLRLNKSGFRLSLNGSIKEVLTSLALHWLKILENPDNLMWLRVIFSTHYTNGESENEYKTITLMLKSQAEVVVGSFNLQSQLQSAIRDLFSSLLLNIIIRVTDDENINIEEEIEKLAILITYLKEK